MVDHLHLPAEPSNPPPLIPYVVRNSPRNAYDGLGFSSFPSRHGINKDLLLQGNFQGRNAADLNEFFQSWLFFGMLHEVLTTAGEDFSLEEFVRTEKDGQRTITTLPLRRHLCNWRQREVHDGSTNEPIPWYEKLSVIDVCLEEAVGITRKLLSRSASQSLPAAQQPAVIPEICLSIVILGSTLNAAKDSIVPRWYRDRTINDFGSTEAQAKGILLGEIPYMPRDTLVWGPVAYTIQRLQDNGWCPMEIEMLQELSDVGMYYVSNLGRPQLNINNGHTNCTERECVAFQIDNDRYRPQHRPGCENCNALSIPTAQIAESVMDGHIPLIMVKKKEGSLECVLEYADGRDYIAISHVWAQGLGNKRENALPLCQLYHIWASVADLYDSGPRTERVLLWIDTLCVPLTPVEAKKEAIARMKEVYHRAHTVLVLDEELQRISYPLSIEPTALHIVESRFERANSNLRELYYRLYVSPWFRRLWTLQEGALAKNLRVKFANELCSLRDIVQSELNQNLFDNPYHAMDSTPMHLCLSILDLQVGDHATLLGRVSPLLGYRDTSELPDEAVCIGGILNIDTRRIIQAGDTAEERMLDFYQQMSSVPVGLIFLDGPKLQTEGFRWAPTSLLGKKQSLTQSLEYAKTGQILDLHRGLYVPNMGFLLQNPNRPLTATFYVENLRPLFQVPGLEGSLGDMEEIMEIVSSLLEDLSPFSNAPNSGLNTVWRLSYSGDTPWEDLAVGKSDFGVIVEESLVHTGDTGVFKKAVLVADLAPHVEEVAEDGSTSVYEVSPQDYNGSEETSIMGGRFIANLRLETLSVEDWERTRGTITTEEATILTPRAGARINNWIVR